MNIITLCCLLLVMLGNSEADIKGKKALADYTEADLERLYEEWEENDEDKLEEDELPEHKRKPATIDLDDLRKKANSPEDLMRSAKKGQTLMMFVGVADPSRPAEKSIRGFTDKWTGIWQSSLFNNHVDAQVFVVDDNRAIFMFKDGEQAFAAKDFLIKQEFVTEVTLEGQQFPGPAFALQARVEL